MLWGFSWGYVCKYKVLSGKYLDKCKGVYDRMDHVNLPRNMVYASNPEGLKREGGANALCKWVREKCEDSARN